MGAMVEEIEPFLSESNKNEPLLNFFKKMGMVEYGANLYYKAKYRDVDTVLSYSKIGKVNASLTATILIEHFKCDISFFLE